MAIKRSFAAYVGTAVLAAILAVGGSLVGRAIYESVTAEERSLPVGPSPEVAEEESSKPLFEGDLMGVYFTRGGEVPEKYLASRDVCTAENIARLGLDEAGDLDLSVTLPALFELDQESDGTGVAACGGTVYGASWWYVTHYAHGYQGYLAINRTRFNVVSSFASADRVKTTIIGGLPAILVEPLTENGIGSQAGIFFPGAAVYTQIISSGVSRADLLTVAELVADQLRAGAR